MVQSIDRAVDIIQILDSCDKKDYWSISEITDRTSLPISTVHRLLNSLMKNGLVSQIPETKHYTLGPIWMEIGLRQLERVDFRIVAKESMERLAYEVEESVYLSVLNGTYSTIIERIDSPLKVRVIDNLGERIPLHIGAPNKIMLAQMKSEESHQLINGYPFLTPEQKQTFSEQLVTIRNQGYAVSYGEKTEGTASIAAPIIGFSNKVVGALSVGVTSNSINQDRLDTLIDSVKKAASEISTKIGRTSIV
ncbi:IclR family transcriptional regulator [Priestia megaterium]